MKRVYLTVLFAIGWVASAMSQTASEPNEGARLSRGTENTYTFLWRGHAGRIYFLQHSDDLMTWVYFPDIIEAGINIPLGYGFPVSGPNRYFVRLRSADFPFGNPSTADSDGDGLGNWDELQRGTDPLVRDSDGDGMSDGNEYLIGRNALLADSPVDGSDRSLDVHTPLAP